MGFCLLAGFWRPAHIIICPSQPRGLRHGKGRLLLHLGGDGAREASACIKNPFPAIQDHDQSVNSTESGGVSEQWASVKTAMYHPGKLGKWRCDLFMSSVQLDWAKKQSPGRASTRSAPGRAVGSRTWSAAASLFASCSAAFLFPPSLC